MNDIKCWNCGEVVAHTSEVHHLFDELFVDFIEEHGIQVWQDRDTKNWTVQCPKPFKQVTKDTLKGALTKLAFEMGHLKFRRNFQEHGKDAEEK